MIQFGCPHCGGHFQIDPSMAGAEIACPACQGPLIVPTDQPVDLDPSAMVHDYGAPPPIDPPPYVGGYGGEPPPVEQGGYYPQQPPEAPPQYYDPNAYGAASPYQQPGYQDPQYQQPYHDPAYQQPAYQEPPIEPPAYYQQPAYAPVEPPVDPYASGYAPPQVAPASPPPPPPPPPPPEPKPDIENVKLRDPSMRAVGEGPQKRVIRKLSPEERAARRLRYRIIMISIGFAMLLVVLVVLLAFRP